MTKLRAQLAAIAVGSSMLLFSHAAAAKIGSCDEPIVFGTTLSTAAMGLNRIATNS